MIENKHSQSETVGFILIVVIVAVIGMIFLWFMFLNQNDNNLYTSSDISDLLTSSLLYTTNCSTTFVPQYESLQDLIKKCYVNSGNLCIDGRTVCEVLNHTIEETINKVLDVGENSVFRAYNFEISYYLKNSSIPKKEFFSVIRGNFNNCTERFGGNSLIYQPPGYLEIKLQVCKNYRIQ